MSDARDRRVDLVRPYMMTRGRTRPQGVDLPLEALISTTPRGRSTVAEQAFERRPILQQCETPVSIAEVASGIGVPLGVARVVVADLVGDGLVQVHQASQTDGELVRRLIDGVRAL